MPVLSCVCVRACVCVCVTVNIWMYLYAIVIIWVRLGDMFLLARVKGMCASLTHFVLACDRFDVYVKCAWVHTYVATALA
jgi:hypothetical protein